ncbi:MAG TPA: hypothetical protein VFH42_07950 [Sporolactobacillaceae bacterium]|nr:hypothetical protein [Sporolactobacillaceae bacterium]
MEIVLKQGSNIIFYKSLFYGGRDWNEEGVKFDHVARIDHDSIA